MKKITAILLVVLMLCALCACGAKEETPAPAAEAPAPTEAPVEESVEETPAPEAPDETSPADIARSLIDHDVAELYEAIGEPESSDYAPSCLVDGGEDGNLYYDGFTVYTLKQGDSEKVYDVE